MYHWQPRRVVFEPDALNYPLGQELYQRWHGQPGIAVQTTPSHNRVTGIPGKSASEAYAAAKQTLVVGVRRGLDFATCKPSAHWQLPLVTSCPGQCEYCYLNTTLGKKPYLRVYVNLDEILQAAAGYIARRSPELTVFEGAATGDPLAVEDYTHALAAVIAWFGQQELGRFRFVTKFTNVDSLLAVDHRQHTRWRFSLNSPAVIDRWERATPRLEERLLAVRKVQQAGYPLGLIIAPIFLYDGWQQDYGRMLQQTATALPAAESIAFELIAHRYTQRAKQNILDRQPDSQLPMQEDERRYKYGQFGYGKYVYPQDSYQQLEEFFRREIERLFPAATIDYLV